MIDRKWILFAVIGLLVLAACAPIEPASEVDNPTEVDTSGAVDEGDGSQSDVQQGLEAESGAVEGQVLIGPTCAAVQEGKSCEDQPYQAVISVLGAEAEVLSTIQTDEDGRFQLDLAPGAYTLQPMTLEAAESLENAEESDVPVPLTYPRAEETIVTVLNGEVTQITIIFDSGIR